MLELLVQGITSNRELAERLFVSENTIKYHLRHILDKLHLQNRAQVIAYALRHGLVEQQDATSPKQHTSAVSQSGMSSSSAHPKG